MSDAVQLVGVLDPRSGWEARRCSLAKALDVLGTRTSFLLMREAFYGTTRFDDFVTRIGASEPVTAARLRELVEAGLLEREPYREPGQRTRQGYRLTEKGGDLLPAMVGLMQWATAGRPTTAARCASAIATAAPWSARSCAASTATRSAAASSSSSAHGRCSAGSHRRPHVRAVSPPPDVRPRHSPDARPRHSPDARPRHPPNARPHHPRTFGYVCPLSGHGRPHGTRGFTTFGRSAVCAR